MPHNLGAGVFTPPNKDSSKLTVKPSIYGNYHRWIRQATVQRKLGLDWVQIDLTYTRVHRSTSLFLFIYRVRQARVNATPVFFNELSTEAGYREKK